jgi:radical SAM protein with 4Fe4S-binding SPASM domain
MVNITMLKSFLNRITSSINSLITRKSIFLPIQLDIINQCNLKCTHCYQGEQRGGGLELSKWILILDQYKELQEKLGMKACIFISGGEALISPILKPLISEIRKRWEDGYLSILSNGIAINDDIIKIAKLNDISFQISLDGYNSNEHDKIRGNGSFAKTITNIIKLRYCNIHVIINTVLTRVAAKNIEHFFKLAKSLHVNRLDFTRLIIAGSAIEAKNQNTLTPLELKKSYENILNASKKYQLETSTASALWGLLKGSAPSYRSFGSLGLVVDYNGNLLMSSKTGYKLGNLLESNLSDLYFNHPLMIKARSTVAPSCQNCRDLRQCGGGDREAAYAERGDFFADDPGCWNLPGNIIK